MVIKYNIDINKKSIEINLKRIINQIYKLLPSREEGEDWKKPLETIIEELVGMNTLLRDCQSVFFTLLCKLQGLFEYDEEDDFLVYRRTIFECLGLLGGIKDYVISK